MVREALFNILGDDVVEATVLDLYAGTGALGIEALSRGAASATFVDTEAACVQAILQSLARAGLDRSATVLRGTLPAALRSLQSPFTLVLMDPPYQEDTAIETLTAIASHLQPSAQVVYEHSSRYNPPERPLGLVLRDRRTYGDSALAFYRSTEGE
jgi:16S rRNA (guanine966-N2)-methyltransferase